MAMLPTSSIYTNLVAQTLGVGSNDVGRLCTEAKTGGSLIPSTSIYTAYDIEELGGSATGYLISGAVPLHNYFSKSPSHWEFYVKQNTTPIIMGLKNRLNNKGYIGTKQYSFNLGDFREYNHFAIQPSAEQSLFGTYYIDNIPSPIPVRVQLSFQDIDWELVKTKSTATASWLTNPYITIFSIKADDVEYNYANTSETGYLQLGTDGEISGFIDNQTNSILASKTFSIKFKIGQGATLTNAFVIDDWFNCDVSVVIYPRPTLSSDIYKFETDGQLNDGTMFVTQNLAATLGNNSGGGWTGTVPYSNGYITGSIQALTNFTTITVDWYITSEFVNDGGSLQDAITSGTAVFLKTTVLNQSASYTNINLGTTGLTFSDDIEYTIVGYVSSYTI